MGKVRAGLRISLVSGAFWAVGGAVLGVALSLLAPAFAGFSLSAKLMMILLNGVMTGVIGLIGGAFYALALATQARRGEGFVLTTGKAALAGAASGVALILCFQLILRPLISAPIPPPNVIGMLISATLFAGFGAATGAAIVGTAKRGKLPVGDEVPDQIAR